MLLTHVQNVCERYPTIWAFRTDNGWVVLFYKMHEEIVSKRIKRVRLCLNKLKEMTVSPSYLQRPLGRRNLDEACREGVGTIKKERSG